MIENQKEFDRYIAGIKLKGFGGTDFRPAIDHIEKLKAEGYEEVALIDTTDKFFKSPQEAKCMMLGGSTLLFGKK